MAGALKKVGVGSAVGHVLLWWFFASGLVDYAASTGHPAIAQSVSRWRDISTALSAITMLLAHAGHNSLSPWTAVFALLSSVVMLYLTRRVAALPTVQTTGPPPL